MNLHRLVVLETKLRSIPESRFDISTWVGTKELPWGGAEDLSCGTVACALGWAATIPEFRELGLRLERREILGTQHAGLVAFEQEHGFGAAGKFFDLSLKASLYIFSASNYALRPTPTQVADRIAGLIANPLNFP